MGPGPIDIKTPHSITVTRVYHTQLRPQEHTAAHTADSLRSKMLDPSRCWIHPCPPAAGVQSPPALRLGSAPGPLPAAPLGTHSTCSGTDIRIIRCMNHTQHLQPHLNPPMHCARTQEAEHQRWRPGKAAGTLAPTHNKPDPAALAPYTRQPWCPSPCAAPVAAPRWHITVQSTSITGEQEGARSRRCFKCQTMGRRALRRSSMRSGETRQL